MADLLSRRAAASPRAVAIESPDSVWRYRDLDDAADAVAEAIRRAGLGGGTLVAALLEVTPAALAAVHGVPRAGAVLAPADPGWSDEELRRFVERLRPSALLASDEVRLPLEAPPFGGGAGAPLRGVGLRLGRLHASDAARPTVAARAHSVLWTSGTAGEPRAVRLTQGNHLAVARGAARRLDLGPGDRWLASLALSHVGGLALVLRAAYTGARLVTRPYRFDPDDFVRFAKEGRITHAALVPTMLHQLLEACGSSPRVLRGLRCVLVGGAGTPPALLERALTAGVPAALTYGLTEAASQVATAPPALVRRKPGTAGPPLPGVKVRIVGGEIRVRGRSVMRGYLQLPSGNPAAGRAVARPSRRRKPFDEDGWLRTGDAGELDEEGHLRVTGRLTDRIITGGVNVDPAGVEAALEGAPGIAELAVTSVADPVWGERVVAVAAPRDGGELDVAALEQLARDRLSSPRRPRAWISVRALPRNANGKVERATLREIARERLRPSSQEGPSC